MCAKSRSRFIHSSLEIIRLVVEEHYRGAAASVSELARANFPAGSAEEKAKGTERNATT